MWHMGDGWGWWIASGWLWMLALWALVFWAVVTLAGRHGAPPRRDQLPPEAGPLEILERRYASGELTDEQFEAMRQRLLGRTSTPDDGSHQGAAPA
jgi:putative membrane protein